MPMMVFSVTRRATHIDTHTLYTVRYSHLAAATSLSNPADEFFSLEPTSNADALYYKPGRQLINGQMKMNELVIYRIYMVDREFWLLDDAALWPAARYHLAASAYSAIHTFNYW